MVGGASGHALSDARTLQRALLEDVWLPRFAARFTPDQVVVNIGAGKFPYRDAFACRLRTADVRPDAADECWALEACPYPDAVVDGVLLFGVFERLSNPVLAMVEVFRILKPGGLLLFGAPGIQFPYRVERDRWRLTAGGLSHVLQAFEVLERADLGDVGETYHLVVARTPSARCGDLQTEATRA